MNLTEINETVAAGELNLAVGRTAAVTAGRRPWKPRGCGCGRS